MSQLEGLDRLDRLVAKLRQDGFDEGLDLGRKATLLHQLEFRFGRLPLTLVLRVATGDGEDLEEWSERILTRKTIQGVFGGPIWVRTEWLPKRASVSIADRARQEGRVEGELRGRRWTLIGQLERRFTLPERMREQVLRGTPAELDVWELRVLDSATLDEVFSASS